MIIEISWRNWIKTITERESLLTLLSSRSKRKSFRGGKINNKRRRSIETLPITYLMSMSSRREGRLELTITRMTLRSRWDLMSRERETREEPGWSLIIIEDRLKISRIWLKSREELIWRKREEDCIWMTFRGRLIRSRANWLMIEINKKMRRRDLKIKSLMIIRSLTIWCLRRSSRIRNTSMIWWVRKIWTNWKKKMRREGRKLLSILV